jgi:cytochrome c553
MTFRSIFAVVVVLAPIQAGCGDESDPRSNQENISHHGGTESHRAGENCISCHREGGDGTGWFTIAGTVYYKGGESVHPNTTVRLFMEPGGMGETVRIVEVDDNGNFFTTEPLDFEPGLYPALYSDSSSEKKALVTTEGACSSCHGVNVDRLFVE